MTPRPTSSVLGLGTALPLLLVVIFHHLCVDFAAASNPFSAEEKQATVDRHNELRREQGASDMNYMNWDDGLASHAQQTADSCLFEHSNEGVTVGEFDYIGENIFALGGDPGDPKTGVQATDEWYSEIDGYNLDANTCSATCGHYTQVVWAKSKAIGCGRKFCPTLTGGFDNAWFIVCNYGPAGNVNNERPFQRGDPCTKCDSGSGQCDEGLCRPCSEHSGDCVCNQQCENCGELDNECKCSCPNGFLGGDCSEVCEDTHEMCGANPGWPDADACSLGPDVPIGCPLMCGVCNAQDEGFECTPGQSGGSGGRGTGSGGRGTGGNAGGGGGGAGRGQGGGGGRGRGQGAGEEGDNTGGICSQPFTAATYIDDMLYLFHGGKLWKVSSDGQLQSPVEGENAQDSFHKLPNDVSAVYQRQNGNVVFLRDKKMYIFQGRKRIAGHPIKFTEWGVDSHIHGAVHDSQRDKTLFFKRRQFWRYNDAAKRIDNGYPKNIEEEYEEKLNKPDMVFSDPSGNYYFVKNQKVFRVRAGGRTVDSGYPKPFAPEFFSDC